MTPNAGWLRNLGLVTNNSTAQPINVTNVLSIPDGKVRGPQGTGSSANSPDGVFVPQSTATSTVLGTWTTGQDSTFVSRLNRISRLMQNYSRWHGGSAGTVPTGWDAEFVMDDGGMVLGATQGNNTMTTGQTAFQGPWTPATLQTTNAAANVPIPVAGTLKNFCFGTNTSQPANNSLVATVMINSVATTIVATVALSQTAGQVCDYTHTASVNANDEVAVRYVNNANTTSAAIIGWTMELLPSGTTFAIGAGGLGSIASTVTTFSPAFVGTVNATEAAIRHVMPRAGTTTKLCIDISTASAQTMTATLMKNGSATALAVTSTASTTGVTCGTTGGPISFAQGDTFSMRFVQAAGGGASTVSGWSIDFQ